MYNKVPTLRVILAKSMLESYNSEVHCFASYNCNFLEIIVAISLQRPDAFLKIRIGYQLVLIRRVAITRARCAYSTEFSRL